MEEGCPDHEGIYIWILLYALTKFGAEFVNYIREIPFAYIAANAEKHIAAIIYEHVQSLSLAWHLHRETGKVIRIVGKGAHSFAHILRYMLFNILPLIIEICFILGVIASKYNIVFFITNLICFIVYTIITLVITECRAHHFKEQAIKDSLYV